jgi:2-dehydropantoate 2-reductase
VNKDSPILLVGLGAIGSVILSRLNKKKYSVICLSTEEGAENIRIKGLSVKLFNDKDPKQQKCEIYSDLPEDFIFDSCIITAKSWANNAIAQKIKNNLSLDASILLFQNGIRIEESFLKHNEQWSITRALTSLAAYREDRTVAFETNVGETRIGGINHQNKQVMKFWNKMLTNIGLNIEVSNDILREIWLKSIVNCSILPLGAITGLKNGEVIKDQILNKIIHDIIGEILSVIKDEIAITFDEAYSLTNHIVSQTADHKCSMLQDVERGVKTEIDSLNGKIVEIAKEKNLEITVNKKLTEIMKKISEEKIPNELGILELRSLI